MTDEPTGFDNSIRSYYDKSSEESRLFLGSSKIEAARTRLVIHRFAPRPPAVVYDVGGAAGAYAFWLAESGYEVHLVDPVPRLIRLAREKSGTADHPLASMEIGDARNLRFSDASADCVLLLGPLYHLTDCQDRILALTEATRVLKQGGVLFAACITRWSSLFDGLARDYLRDPAFVELMEEDLKTGQHRNPTGRPEYFTSAYFHTPDRFEEELDSSGLRVEGIVGLEGPAPLLADFDHRWSNERRRADLMRVAEVIEEEPSLRGLSPHLLGVCRKL